MNGIDVGSDVARARALGVRVTLSEAQDRLPRTWGVWRAGDDARGAQACPTCEDGILTITHPRRCRECVNAGF